MAAYERIADWYSLLEQLNERQRRLFACDCAEHVLSYFEDLLPDDGRVRQVIDVARGYARGNASKEELLGAKSAAESAAWYAGQVAWTDYPGSFVADAGASCAASAEASCAQEALEAAINAASTAVEAAEIAAVGSEVADRIWANGWEAADPQQAVLMREAKVQEENWQKGRALIYISENKE